MRAVLSISVDASLKDEIDRLCRSSELSRSEIVKRALRHYLTVQRMRATRVKLRPYAERAGLFTDEDIFTIVS